MSIGIIVAIAVGIVTAILFGVISTSKRKDH
jgi:ABC-type uncharacterized transport system permease subunit